MATLNAVCIPKGKVIDGIIDLTTIEQALSVTSIKYNTTLQADVDSIYFAPEVIADAVAMVGCTIVQSCDLPTVLEAKEYNFMQGCNLCLNTLTSNEKKAFGMDSVKPIPTPALSNRYENKFIQSILNSTRKINWLGNKTYVAGNLANAALLPNYTKANGIWTNILALAPAAPRFSGLLASRNALTTKAAQTTFTAAEVLGIIDGMRDLQSVTMKLVVDTEKYVWLTNELYDRLIYAMKVESFSLCCVGTMQSQVSGGVEINIIEYGDLKLIKYDEFTAGIRDLALVGGTAWNLPNRAVLALGLPIVNYIQTGVFVDDFKATTGAYDASYSLSTAIVDPYPGDFYVVGF
tara:strand:- start:498 stop:1544 length:1047 start_codon:yes stop_codon:yes gene_type:complete